MSEDIAGVCLVLKSCSELAKGCREADAAKVAPLE